MPSKRRILYKLKRTTLLDLVDFFDLSVQDRRVKDGLVDALAGSRRASLEKILSFLSRDTLKSLCREFGLDDSGRSKAVIAARLTGTSDEKRKGASTQRKTSQRISAQGKSSQGKSSQGKRSQGKKSRGKASRRRNELRISKESESDEHAALNKQSDSLRKWGKTTAQHEKQKDQDEKTRHYKMDKKKKKVNKADAAGTGGAGESKNGSLGFENKLWEAADLLRNNMDPAEYKHVVLGLLFLKYIADAFEERRQDLQKAVADPGSDYYVKDPKERGEELENLLEDRDEFIAENVFWVPKQARWRDIQAQAKQPNIGKVIDDAMDAIERDNPRLKDALPKIYALAGLDKQNLGKLIDLIAGIGLGTKAHQDKDTLGRVYEYFLSKFASAEGKGGGEFYTPVSIVRLLVAMLEPYKGRVYDPCCGSGGMFVQSLKFIEAHNGRRNQITVYGQESNRTTWRMARMNLAIRGIEANLGKKHADSFHEDLHPDLRADFILANPPFNISQWGGERLENDVRWKYGRPPVGNANFAWVQHFIHHLAPTGTAGFVLANGSMSSMTSGEGEIRQRIIEADLVDCVVACPGQLFYATQIPVCLWFLTKNKAPNGHRNRRGETLFIDARKLGEMESRVHRVFSEKDIEKVAGTYHEWRNKGGKYKDVPGFCKSANLEEIKAHDFVLTPGRYVGAAEIEENDFNLNIPRYMDTFEKKEEIDTNTVQVEIDDLEKELGEVRKQMAEKMQQIQS